jgi:hypothetical protein
MSIEAMKQALEALEYPGPSWPDGREKAAQALRTAIAEAEKREPVAWKNAAIRLGEELSSVGPDGYYNMTAAQWLDWAMDQQPRGKNSLTTPPAAQRQPLNWTVVGKQMPDSGVIVLAYYKNSHGKDRRIRAKWVAAKTMEASGDWEGDCDYDEEADTYYCPAGWYECIDNWSEYTSVFVHEGQITHWMPLPEAPAIEAAHGIGEKK